MPTRPEHDYPGKLILDHLGAIDAYQQAQSSIHLDAVSVLTGDWSRQNNLMLIYIDSKQWHTTITRTKYHYWFFKLLTMGPKSAECHHPCPHG